MKLPIFTPGTEMGLFQSFSIIIPARNEEKNIGVCLESILKNNYPQNKFEIMVIDDFSTDNTASIVNQYSQKYPHVHLIELKNIISGHINSFKKKAIEIAVDRSSYEWIITTDADCMVGKDWLKLFNAFINEKKPVFIAAPVLFTHQGGFLSLFQSLDFISLQGITAASVSAGFHSMCNGANLAYQKEAFFTVNGFQGLDKIASGDDMLLMNKFKKQFPGKIAYLYHPGSIVQTAPMGTWKNFINQRIRWASKATHYDDKKIFFVLLWVYLLNVFLFAVLIYSFFKPGLIVYWLGIIFIKTIIELLLMYPAAKFFNRQRQLWWFPLMQPFHIIYTVISGLFGSMGTYQWKGRKVH
ncbi:MAG: glycosyltransferase [Bacteroidetes bacterium]|nr:glycosyltransferase [Bacteroidota bacterium]